MTSMYDHDRLEVVNGPEDGTQFPLTRTPADIGAGPSADIHIRFDSKIAPSHARITVIADGYRIRRLDRSAVWAGGKRAGKIHSRIVRDGDIIRVGNTEIALRCAPGGLAGRTRGIAVETDVEWAVRLLGARLRPFFRSVVRGTRWFLRRVGIPLAVVAVLLFVIAAFRPSLLQSLANAARLGWYYVRLAIHNLMNVF